MDGRGSKSSGKLVNAIETEQSIDRLSGLPDAMLCHILSFLTIKESVATSILARRWRYLWTNFSTLEFDTRMCKRSLDKDTDDDIFLGHNIRHGHGNSHSRYVIESTSCSDIVNRLLLMQNMQVLNTFVLYYKRFGFTDYQIDSWMTVAMARGVKKIGIHCVSVDEHPRARPWRNKLPSSLFRCKTLVDLSLTRCSVYIPTNGIVSLSSLKKLCLVYIKYGDDETLPRLLSGCPDLEKFRMDQENFKWVTVKYLPKLIEADIILYKPLHLGRPWPVGILNGFSNAKSMKLSYRCGEFAGSKFEALTSKFTNLIELQWLSSDCRLLVKFLEKADNLKHLTALLIDCWLWRDPPHVFNCLLSHLETAMVGLMYVDDKNILLVRYLLKNAKVLKVMTVGIYDDLSTIDKEILQDNIISLERGSPQCMIVFRGLQDCVYSVC